MARSSKRQQRLSDGYSFPGFEAQAEIRGVFGDPGVRFLRLIRRSKKPPAGTAGWSRPAGTTGASGTRAIFQPASSASSWNSRAGASPARPAAL